MNTEAKLISALLIVSTLCLTIPATAVSQPQTDKPESSQSIIPSYITNYTVFSGDPKVFSPAAQSNSTISLPFFDTTIKLRPMQRYLLSNDFKSMIVDELGRVWEQPAPDISTFGGSVDGDPDSRIAIAIAANTINGFLFYRGSTYTIEPISQYSKNPDYSNQYLVYPNKGIKIDQFSGQPSCHSFEVNSSDALWEKSFAASAEGTKLCRLTLACDLEYYNLYPTTWSLQMLLVIAGVDNVYAWQIDTAMSVTATVAFLSGLTSTDCDTLRGQFRNKMIDEDKVTYMPRDAAHLFSGKIFTCGHLGSGDRGTLAGDWAYSVSTQVPQGWYYATIYERQMLVAHEIAHNFGSSDYYGDYWQVSEHDYVYSICYESFMGNLITPKFSDGTGVLAHEYGDHDNAAIMRATATGRLTDWSPRTIPAGKHYNFCTYDVLEGQAYHIDTTGGSEYGFTFFGYTSSATCIVRPDGKLHFVGRFRQYDTFPGYLQPGRRQLLVYALDSVASQILASKEILNYANGTNWYVIEGDLGGLTAGQVVRFAVGRPDGWSQDWQLTAEWAAVTVYGEYSGRTSPSGRYYSFYPISTTYGDGYRIRTTGSSDYGYTFYGYTGQTFTVGTGGQITVLGNFRHDDTMDDSLAQTRRMTYVYLLDQSGSILQSVLLLNFQSGTNWNPATRVFTNLAAGIYRIGIGRSDDWQYDWHLTVEWTQVIITAN